MTIKTDLLTAKEAAEYLSTTENSLRSMRSKRCGPPFLKEEYYIRYRRSELDAYMASLRPSDTKRMANRRARLEEKRRGALADQ